MKIENLAYLKNCLSSHEPQACVLGNLQAKDVLELISDLEKARTDTHEWYAARLERLMGWFRTTGKELPIAEEFWNIIANSQSGVNDPPTYSQIIEQYKYRAEKAEARIAELEKS